MEFNNIPGPVGRLLGVWLAAFPLEGVMERMKTTECWATHRTEIAYDHLGGNPRELPFALCP